MAKVIFLASGLILLTTACVPKKPNTPVEYEARASYRAGQFQDCMASLPKGPDKTVYNDWAEIVSKCDHFADIQTKYRDGDYR